MKWLKKIDDNLMLALLSIFVFFIPLYPKFPFQVVNYTYIAIRIDDFLAAIIALVFIVNVFRRKIDLKRLVLLKPFLVFWVIVLLAYISGVYITKTIDYPFVGLLHSLRRIEYMIFFFIAMASIKSARDFKFLLSSLIASLLLVNVYGIGQRFFNFPAISTMNPEFAKGRLLYLTPEARLSSTFAGHYDLGAYLVFFMPILWGLFFFMSKTKKIVLNRKEQIFIIVAGLIPTLFSVYSLTSTRLWEDSSQFLQALFTMKFNIIFFLAMFLSLVFFLWLFRRFIRFSLLLIITASILTLVLTVSRTSSIAYLVSTLGFLLFFRKFRYLIFAIVLTSVFSFYNSDLAQRWLSTIQVKQIVLNERTGQEVVVQRIRSDDLPAGTAYVRSKKKGTDTLESELLKRELARDSTKSGMMATNEAEYVTVEAYAGDISISTRFQASWPRAIKAFMKNPLLGTGPSSITESSDGDYFRWLGETGLAGFTIFLLILFQIIRMLFSKARSLDSSYHPFLMSVIFGIFGLLINALLIDVFEASKVAYILWVTLGMYIGFVHLNKKEISKM